MTFRRAYLLALIEQERMIVCPVGLQQGVQSGQNSWLGQPESLKGLWEGFTARFPHVRVVRRVQVFHQ